MRGRGRGKQNSKQRAIRPGRRAIAESNPVRLYCDVGEAIYSISVRNRLPQVNQSNCVNDKKNYNKQTAPANVHACICMHAYIYIYNMGLSSHGESWSLSALMLQSTSDASRVSKIVKITYYYYRHRRYLLLAVSIRNVFSYLFIEIIIFA